MGDAAKARAALHLTRHHATEVGNDWILEVAARCQMMVEELERQPFD